MKARVYIAHPTRNDENEYRQAVRESYDVLHPWVKLDDSAESFDAYLSRYEQDDQLAYLIRQVDGGQLVGFVNANNIIHGAFHSTYLGYGAFNVGGGKGLMMEGMSLVLNDLFNQKELHRAEANIQPANERSIRLVEKLGFRKEGYSPEYLFIDGLWRDHERWAITSEMWKQTS